MPSQGTRGSTALVTAAVALVFLSSVLNFEVAQATALKPRTPINYTVNDDKGWTFDAVKWTEKKQDFRAGDILVFNYISEMHDVVVVNRAGYRNCTATPNDPAYYTGNDRITLHKGHNLFICTFYNHCIKGMKLDVKAM